MSLAMDSASKAVAARTFWISVLLGLCVADLGCAGMRPSHRVASRSGGGLARFRRIRTSGPLLLGARSRAVPPSSRVAPADASATPQRRPSAPEARTIVRSTAPPPGAILPTRRRPDRPVAVALQPPTAEGPRPAAAPVPAPSSATGRDTPAAMAVAPEEDLKPASDPDAPAAGDRLEELAALVASARAKLEGIATYQVRLTRQERVGEVLQPAEDLLLSIRRRPRAVRLEWTEGPHKGREVLYSASENGGLMHVKMADSLVPVPPLALPPDSPLALRTSRHPITEAGFDTILARLEDSLKHGRQADSTEGHVSDAGPETPEELGRPCRKIVRKKPTGETWTVYIDSETQLPALVQATAADGALLEKYLFRDLRTDLPELASAAAFDPNQRWGRAGGLWNRLARATGSDSKTPADASSP